MGITVVATVPACTKPLHPRVLISSGASFFKGMLKITSAWKPMMGNGGEIPGVSCSALPLLCLHNTALCQHFIAQGLTQTKAKG